MESAAAKSQGSGAETRWNWPALRVYSHRARRMQAHGSHGRLRPQFRAGLDSAWRNLRAAEAAIADRCIAVHSCGCDLVCGALALFLFCQGDKIADILQAIHLDRREFDAESFLHREDQANMRKAVPAVDVVGRHLWIQLDLIVVEHLAKY